ncbi:MAG: molybdenum cofactor guanylyltransferase [Lachnospirales bacterium]
MFADTTAVILCGGKSLRMGFDKSLLEFDGQFVLLKTMEEIKKLFDKVILVTNTKEKFPKDFSAATIVEDNYIGKGPLGGLVTALESVETDNVFLLACDMPNLNLDLINIMGKFVKDYDIVICGKGKKLEPLYAFYSKKCLPTFQNQLMGENLRIRKEFDKFLVKVVSLEEEMLINVNTPKDLSLWTNRN